MSNLWSKENRQSEVTLRSEQLGQMEGIPFHAGIASWMTLSSFPTQIILPCV